MFNISPIDYILIELKNADDRFKMINASLRRQHTINKVRSLASTVTLIYIVKLLSDINKQNVRIGELERDVKNQNGRIIILESDVKNLNKKIEGE